VPHAQEEWREVQRRREHPRGCAGRPIPVGTDEPERAVSAQGVGQTGLPAEIEEIRAASHRDVLAGIDKTTRHRILERGGSTTGTASGLEQRHPHIGGGNRRRGRETCQAATNHDDVLAARMT
jgi:hypothetical protein